MRFISHRGNLEGAQKDLENLPDQIDKAISQGFDVEIDLWLHNGSLYLGHDGPEHKTSDRFLIDRSPNLWIHAKSIDTVSFLFRSDLNWFWHETDKFALTSKEIPWSFPEIFFESCVVNQPADSSKFWTERLHEKMNFHAICHDDIMRVRKEIGIK